MARNSLHFFSIYLCKVRMHLFHRNIMGFVDTGVLPVKQGTHGKRNHDYCERLIGRTFIACCCLVLSISDVCQNKK